MAPQFTQGSLWWAWKTGCLSGFWAKLFMRGWKLLGCSAERRTRDVRGEDDGEDETRKQELISCSQTSPLCKEHKTHRSRSEGANMVTPSDTKGCEYYVILKRCNMWHPCENFRLKHSKRNKNDQQNVKKYTFWCCQRCLRIVLQTNPLKQARRSARPNTSRQVGQLRSANGSSVLLPAVTAGTYV